MTINSSNFINKTGTNSKIVTLNVFGHINIYTAIGVSAIIYSDSDSDHM